MDCVEASTCGAWFWIAVATLPLAVLPALAAVLWVPGWPGMGRKYDAPAERGAGGP